MQFIVMLMVMMLVQCLCPCSASSVRLVTLALGTTLQMYVVSGGQFFKPSSVASSNLALQSKAAGSGWVDLMLKHLNMAGDNPNAQGGYLMDGGAIIATPDGWVGVPCNAQNWLAC